MIGGLAIALNAAHISLAKGGSSTSSLASTLLVDW
jgi:hypothetical protein